MRTKAVVGDVTMTNRPSCRNAAKQRDTVFGGAKITVNVDVQVTDIADLFNLNVKKLPF